MVQFDRTESFFRYFRNQLALIKSLASDPRFSVGFSDPALGLAMHKKILYSAILDSLARIRYRDEKLTNRERFIRFLREFTAWINGDLVSASVLRLRLKAGSPLTDHLDIRLGSRSLQGGNALPITKFDEPATILLPLATAAERGELESCQHFSLFYAYRNYIVHEFREPGHAMETFANGGAEPLYHAYIDATTWSLLYPVGFFAARVEAAIESLEQWFKANLIDPFDRVSDTSAWSGR
jgi:hypothetical protein